MNLLKRIELVEKLGKYMSGSNPDWIDARQKAFAANAWFLPEFIELASTNIVQQFLTRNALNEWVKKYPELEKQNTNPKTVGIVMAGNIPMVGFHDMLCVFISGNKSLIKLSSKDEILIKHLADKLMNWDAEVANYIRFETFLKGCDAYIATGSNNSAGYFAYYFGKYPNLIRRNKTSVAILTGNETDEELNLLADDVYQFFGMGCRNVTKLYVPENYNFEKLLNIFKKYDFLAEENKYKNNYDYNLALHILNNRYYMSNASIILVEDESIFSPVSQLHYSFYKEVNSISKMLKENKDVQCIVSSAHIPFGKAQCPAIDDYADGEDTMQFLVSI